MEIKLSIDSDDLYGDYEDQGSSFEQLVTDALKAEVTNHCKKGLATEQFKEFTVLVSDTIISGVKLKMENFLSEEIALTDQWGKAVFVGSIEDLMKKRFDDVLLRPVNGDGKTIEGCSTSGQKTWIEWMIEDSLRRFTDNELERATKIIKRDMESYVDDKIVEIKDSAIKEQVDSAFSSILKQDKP